MATKMSSAPVFYTLAQVKFNPIDKMPDYIAEIQDRLRVTGYPDSRTDLQMALEVRRLNQNPPEVTNQRISRWSFSNIECTEGYLLLTDALIFHTTVYDSFQDFLNKLLIGLNLVHEVIGLSYIERIGLRYLNAVFPHEKGELEEYLNPSLLGLSEVSQGILTHSFSETQSQIGEGTLVARAVIVNDALALPPDLSPLQLTIQPRFNSLSGKVAVLDMDYFVTKRFAFEIGLLKTQLKAFHEILTKTFKLAVTSHALESWNKK
jgi:uncharacterized protein (TIGR04255 family)